MTYLFAVWPKAEEEAEEVERRGKSEIFMAKQKKYSVNFLVACATEFMTIEQSANTAKTKVELVQKTTTTTTAT